MDNPDEIVQLARAIAASIARRDIAMLRGLLAPGFVYRAHGGATADAGFFLREIERIPGEITFVRLESLEVDLCPTGALATGVQHAQVVVSGEAIDDRRRFVDWFVRIDGRWHLQAAVDWQSE